MFLPTVTPYRHAAPHSSSHYSSDPFLFMIPPLSPPRQDTVEHVGFFFLTTIYTKLQISESYPEDALSHTIDPKVRAVLYPL